MNQDSNTTFNMQPTYALDTKPAKDMDYSSSAKDISPSSTHFLTSASANMYSTQATPTTHLPATYARRGDKIYRADPENINMMGDKTNPSNEKPRHKSSIQTRTVDKVQSGESLYKTFSFEQSSSNDDTEKCIAFWRSVMEKNLAPIKCSIIEQTPSSESSEVQLESESGTSLNSEIARLHDDYKKMVQSVLRDMQRKRLHEIKMYGARCRLCESLSSSLGADSDQMSAVNVEEENLLGELDEWTSQPKKKALPPPPTKQNSTEQQDTSTYQLVDVIDEKTKSGAYTAWRRNTVDPCPCGNLNCDCNTNPAIVSIKVKTGSSDTSSQSETTTSSQDTSTGTSDASSANEEIELVEHKICNINQSVSFVTHCNCGFEDCICQSKQVTVLKSKVTETESHRIIQPKATSNVTVTMSYEVSRETVQDVPRPVKPSEATCDDNETEISKLTTVSQDTVQEVPRSIKSRETTSNKINELNIKAEEIIAIGMNNTCRQDSDIDESQMSSERNGTCTMCPT